MKTLFLQQGVINKSLYFDFLISQYANGGVQIVWGANPDIEGVAKLQSDINGDGVWEDIIVSDLSKSSEITWRFQRPIGFKLRAVAEIEKGSLQRFVVFEAGKVKKDAIKRG